MFRRRRFLFQAAPLMAEQRNAMLKANQLISNGQPLEAGPILVNVADSLQRNNQPQRAANIYARAAHAFTDGKNEQAALENAQRALALFTQNKMVNRTAMFYNNITRKMSATNMKAAAETLRREYGSQIPAYPPIPQGGYPQAHGILPTNCPKCGAPVHTDEVDWVDENSVQCVYCGSLIRAEGHE